MSKKNNSSKIIVILIIIVAIIGVALLCYNVFFKKKEPFTVKHEVVDGLYEKVKTTSCSYVNEDNMGSDTILYLIFTNLKKDDKLTDEIKLSDFKKSGTEILGKNEAVPDEFSNYEFDGYSYTLEGNKITRTKGVCGDKQYISKLYGYSYNEEELTVNIKVGYIRDNKVYDLSDKELGKYDKDTLNELMDQGSGKVYTYSRSGNNYYLKNISNEEIVQR